jgi:hypothetical protein
MSPLHQGAQHEQQIARQARQPARPESAGLAESAGSVADSALLLGAPAKGGRGYAPMQVASLLHLQRTHGNRAVQRLLQRRVTSSAPRLQRQEPPAPAPSAPTSTPGATPPAATPPEAAPPAEAPAAEVTVTFGANADQTVLSATALDIVKDVAQAAGLTSIMISSTARTPTDQARVMYNNLEGAGEGQGVEAQKALYGTSGDQVIDVYVEQKAAGKTADEIKAAMKAKIDELGPTNVSNHCQDPATMIVFDVSPVSVGDTQANSAFATAAEAESRVSNFIPYPDDPGHHFEITP